MSERLAEMHKRVVQYEEAIESLEKEIAIKDFIIRKQVGKITDLQSELNNISRKVKEYVGEFKEMV